MRTIRYALQRILNHPQMTADELGREMGWRVLEDLHVFDLAEVNRNGTLKVLIRGFEMLKEMGVKVCQEKPTPKLKLRPHSPFWTVQKT